jgi:hypothetical protein
MNPFTLSDNYDFMLIGTLIGSGLCFWGVMSSENIRNQVFLSLMVILGCLNCHLIIVMNALEVIYKKL